ncbi:MAG: pseudouridine synthase [Polaromonas sp.]|uniref:RluA family pseudouridine synthase n=1 Tax=Polaromonas sp. TaxID=1869339 RepID=UPI0032676DC7
MTFAVPQTNYVAGNAADTGFEAVYVDEHLLVLNKPAGLLSVPGRGADKQDCLSARVHAAYADACVVHRLDMATSGLMLMARGADMQRVLSRAFENRDIGKRYVAVVAGCMPAPQSPDGWGLIDLPIVVDWPRRPLRIIDAERGKPSRTRWQVLAFDAHANTTRVELEPVTGRSHQLRVHLQALGHPILGDALYAPAAVQAMAPRLLLHASSLQFMHPVSSLAMSFESTPGF